MYYKNLTKGDEYMSSGEITYQNFNENHIPVFPKASETKGAHESLKWAFENYDDIIYACSFGAESMVLIDLIYQIKPDARLIFLDTDLHFQETYDLINRVQERFPKLIIQKKKPRLTLEEQAEKYQLALWKKDPNQCCYIRKIKPLEDVLNQQVAWIYGLRRAQSESRRHTNFINRDERFHSIKVCPLIHWTEDEVWYYIKKHDLPYNELHDFHYPSIGCIPCTSQVFDSDDSRAGRWQGTSKTECGLHSTTP